VDAEYVTDDVMDALSLDAIRVEFVDGGNIDEVGPPRRRTEARDARRAMVRRLSSMMPSHRLVGALLLPGKPLLLRLMTIYRPGREEDDDAAITTTNTTNVKSTNATTPSDGINRMAHDANYETTFAEHRRSVCPQTTEERWQRLIDMNLTSSTVEGGALYDDESTDVRDRNRVRERAMRMRDFLYRRKNYNNNSSSSKHSIIGNSNDTMRSKKTSKEKMDCPVVVTNIDELQAAVLIDKIPLRDVGFRFPIAGIGSESILPGDFVAVASSEDDAVNTATRGQGTLFHRHDPVINGSLSSLLTHRAKTSSDASDIANYQLGIELMGHHPVLSIVRRRVESKSRPGSRGTSSYGGGPSGSVDDDSHLALVIEGGGMRGAVSAGMAAALSTLDLLDAFDSIHGSSAGAIVGAYLVSRQLCTDVYTDIMPAAGPRFASRRRGMVNFGVDWLGDLIRRKLLSPSSSDDEDYGASGGDETDGICVDESDDFDNDDNATSWWCEDANDISSIELAMGTSNRNSPADASSRRRGRRWSDDHYDGVVLESANYLLSNVFGAVKSYVSVPLSSGARRLGTAIRPALSAIDFASSMRQYLKRRPGMNLT
jgi:hypothetical protein